MRILLPLVSIAALGLTACQPSDTPSESFGLAVRQNMQAQIINPDPADTTDMSMDGQRAATGMSRYQTNKTYPPKASASGAALK